MVGTNSKPSTVKDIFQNDEVRHEFKGLGRLLLYIINGMVET